MTCCRGRVQVILPKTKHIDISKSYYWNATGFSEGTTKSAQYAISIVSRFVSIFSEDIGNNTWIHPCINFRLFTDIISCKYANHVVLFIWFISRHSYDFPPVIMKEETCRFKFFIVDVIKCSGKSILTRWVRKLLSYSHDANATYPNIS